MEMGWRWGFALEILPNMLWATLNTILAAGVGYAIAVIVGLIFLIGQRTPYKFVNIINREIVEFIRSTPLVNSIILCLFCASTIWNYFICMGVWNDYNRSSFWNLFV
jgi:polar amino acid transport system permease protein